VRSPSLAVLVAFALAAAGCGGGSPKHSPAADWHAAAVAMATGDGTTACGYFTAAVSNELASSSGVSCADAVKELAQPLTSSDRDGVKAVRVTAAAVSGTTATVRYPLTPGLRKLQFTGRSRLVLSGGRWLIAPRSG
jgi:hypothetical protein